MAHVDPNEDEETEVGPDKPMVEVIQCLRGGKEEIRNIVGNKDSKTNPGEVETVAQGDKAESDNVMPNKLFEILARFLKLKKEDNALLEPICSLEEIIGLEVGGVGAVGVCFVVSSAVEVPDWSLVHDV